MDSVTCPICGDRVVDTGRFIRDEWGHCGVIWDLAFHLRDQHRVTLGPNECEVCGATGLHLYSAKAQHWLDRANDHAHTLMFTLRQL